MCQGYAYPFDFPLTASIGSSSRADVTRAIYTVQSVLAGLGYTGVTGRVILVDGDYGPSTERAVLSFQSNNGLVVDGGVGPQTWGALQSYC